MSSRDQPRLESNMKTLTQTLLSASLLAILPTVALANGETLSLNHDTVRAITVAAPALYPEGIETHPKTGEFLLGSVRKGKIIAVAADGAIRTLVDDSRLRSVIGIRVDAERGRLLVNNSDYGGSEKSRPEDKFATAALGIYDLETGAPLQYVDLAGLRRGEAKFANDLTIDGNGNAYVTDSRAAAIYKITPAGDARVFLTHERFRGEGFNLNGIQYHKDGYLLVAKKSDGSLFKVPLNAPEEFSEVTLPKALIGMDGLVLTGAHELIAITNAASGVVSNTIFKLTSDDDWVTANIADTLETGDGFATTGTLKDGKLYVSYGHLNKLGKALKEKTPLIDAFHIRELGRFK